MSPDKPRLIVPGPPGDTEQTYDYQNQFEMLTIKRRLSFASPYSSTKQTNVFSPC